MAAPRKWTDEQIAQAMELYEEHGVAEASRRTGIPKGTVASLAHRNGNATLAMANTQEAVVQMQAKRRLRAEQIKDGFADLTIHMQERAMAEEKGTQAQAWTTSAAISADKLLLMSGEATSRHETRGDLDSQIIRELARAEREAKAEERELADGRMNQPHAIEVESHSATG